MKTKRLNGLKIVGATLAASSTGIAAATLASCAQTTNRFNAIGGDLDREYNVSQATFKALQGQFTLKRENQLKDVPADQRMREMKALDKSLSSINQNYASNKKYSYSLLSSMLVEKARRQYGIKLVTESSAQWSDARKMLIGMQDSLRIYMKSQGLDRKTIDDIIEQSDEKFNIMMDGSKDQNVVGIRQKYDDPLTGIIQAKANILNCFDEINTDIALVCATNRLRQFMDDYSIELKKDEGIKLNLLEGTKATDPFTGKDVEFKEGNDISAFAPRIFKVTRLIDNQEVKFDAKNLLFGYAVRPILKAISRDEYSNEYSLEVDWTCVKSNYLSAPEKVEKTTAHLFACSDKIIHGGMTDAGSIYDYVSAKNTQTISYPISLTKDIELRTLYDTYLNKNKINDQHVKYLDFKWDDPSKCGFDAFFQGTLIEKGSTSETYENPVSALASSGVKVAIRTRGASNDEPTYKRLDEYISSGAPIMPDVRTKDPAKQNDRDVLLDNFLQNCILHGKTIIENESSESHNSAKTILDLSYRNSEYKTDEASANIGEFTHSNYGLSESSYYWLTEQYNKYAKLVNFYTDGSLEEELENLQEEKDMYVFMLSLDSFLNFLCLTGMIANPYTTGPNIAIIIATCVSELAEGHVYELFKKHKYEPLKEFKERVDRFVNREAGQKFINKILTDASELHLIMADEYNCIEASEYIANFTNHYKNAGWQKIKVAMDEYRTMLTSDLFTNFMDAIEEQGVQPEVYQRIIADWKPWHGKYWIATTALQSITVVADLISIGVSLFATPAAAVQNAEKNALHQEMKKTTENIVENSMKKADSLPTTKPVISEDPIPKPIIDEEVKCPISEQLSMSDIATYDAQEVPYWEVAQLGDFNRDLRPGFVGEPEPYLKQMREEAATDFAKYDFKAQYKGDSWDYHLEEAGDCYLGLVEHDKWDKSWDTMSYWDKFWHKFGIGDKYDGINLFFSQLDNCKAGFGVYAGREIPLSRELGAAMRIQFQKNAKSWKLWEIQSTSDWSKFDDLLNDGIVRLYEANDFDTLEKIAKFVFKYPKMYWNAVAKSANRGIKIITKLRPH